MTVRAWALGHLVSQANLQVFDGRPDDSNPSVGYGAPSRDVAIDPDGRAHMYACLYTGAAMPGEDERLTGTGGTLGATFQVTAAGGDQNRCELAVAKVLAALHGQRLPGGGICRVDPFDPIPRTDDAPSPSRTYLPLIFRVAVGDA